MGFNFGPCYEEKMEPEGIIIYKKPVFEDEYAVCFHIKS